MNLKVDYVEVDVDWNKEIPEDVKVKNGFIQEIIVVDNLPTAVLLVGRFFITVPLTRIRTQRTLIN
jgi:hypothetical protein